MVNTLSFLVFIAASISIYVGIFLLFQLLNRRSEHAIKSFTALCFSVAFYQISCGFLYGSDNFHDAMQFQRLNFLGISAIAISLTLYIFEFTRTPRNQMWYLIVILFSLYGLSGCIDSPLTLSITNAHKEMKIYGVTVKEVDLGIVLLTELVASFIVFSYLLTLLFKSKDSLRRKSDRFFIASFIGFFVASFHDILVAAHLISNMYILEYGFLLIILSITYSRSMQFLRLYDVITSLNTNLEQRVLDRTHELELASDEAQRANRIKSLFLANMSHDIRTPMNGIIAMNRFLLESNLDKEQRENAEIVESSSYQLLNLLNDILDYTKIEARQLILEIRPFSLETQLNNIRKLLAPSFEAKGLAFTINNLSRRNWVLGDSTRINQVLLNMLTNAVKFTMHGSVTLSIENGISSMVRFTVSDTGIGIEKSAQQAVFNSFTQEDASTTRKFGGTGLGLAITKQLVQLMDGSISLVSEKGEGTTFIIELALPETEAVINSETVEKSIPLNSDYTSKEILLAEDNPVNTLVARKILESFGLNVVHAENGLRALQIAESKKFDLIFLDIQMPELDGMEATQVLRSSEGINQNTPIIAMTANAMIGDREKYLSAGMNDYISKPISKIAVKNAIELYLN